MKKLILPLIITAVTCASMAYAETATRPLTEESKTPEVMKFQPQIKPETIIQTQNNNTRINFYAEPNSSSAVIATYNVNQHLIPIFQKDGWIKVGDPVNGSIGWINKEQYQQAMNTAIHESLQTVYVEQTDNNGKSSEITVYQNGKKLTGEDAKLVYAKVEKQQQQMQQNMQELQKRMGQWMTQDMQMSNGPMLAMPSFPMVQPVIIVENHSEANSKPMKIEAKTETKTEAQAEAKPIVAEVKETKKE